jgi:aerobic carbon-monoxide dehydrogenase medium subunit
VFPADFAYCRAESLDHALAVLADEGEDEDIKVLAGGQSLLPMMKLRLAVPDVVLDIGGLTGLAAIKPADDGGKTRIGALTTYRSIQQDPLTSSRFPAVADALAVLADPQVRARGTIGGAVAHGDPAADLPAVLLALDAELTVARRPGRRVVAIDAFLRGVFDTDLAGDEIVTDIAIPAAGRGQAYEKFEQPASHLPLAGVCAAVEMSGGVLAAARIAVTGVAARAFRARQAEWSLLGRRPDAAALNQAAAQVRADVHPLADQHASGPFRLHLAEVLTRRALSRALARAGWDHPMIASSR